MCFKVSGTIGDKSRQGASDQESKRPSFFQMDYYRQYFDIDQDQVLNRIVNSFFPKRNTNFIADFIQPNPDLYGPYWISVTLIFTIAIFGNLSTFLQHYSSEQNESLGDFRWGLFLFVTFLLL